LAEIQAIRWSSGKLRLLDQTKLPHEHVVHQYDDYRQVVKAIRDMQVRGAPALGVTAAYAMAMAAGEVAQDSGVPFLSGLEAAGEEIKAARPTAVNVAWAVERMLTLAGTVPDAESAARILLDRAEAIQREDVEINRRIGKHGASLLPQGGGVLTHCNAGALATAGYGTALGVIRRAWEEGNRPQVYHTETRPFLQGARLTAWEFAQLNIPAIMVVDSAAGLLLKDGSVGCVVVGADRIVANGDTANKIGTYTLAVVAHENSTPFYVAAPTSTVDLSMASGDEIPIEERDPEEVTHLGSVQTAASGIDVRNPSFDVTPNRYITAIITEEGVVRQPFGPGLLQAVEKAKKRTALVSEGTRG
jgi:methylthioribose-1-phosphate isomerase